MGEHVSPIKKYIKPKPITFFISTDMIYEIH